MGGRPAAQAIQLQTAIPHQAHGQRLPVAVEDVVVDGALETTDRNYRAETNSASKNCMSPTTHPSLTQHIRRDGRVLRVCPRSNNPFELPKARTAAVVEALALPPEVASNLSRQRILCHPLNLRPEAASEATGCSRLCMGLDATQDRHSPFQSSSPTDPSQRPTAVPRTKRVGGPRQLYYDTDVRPFSETKS